MRLRVRHWLSRTQDRSDQHDLQRVNRAFVRQLAKTMPHAQAMETAIGGGFEVFGKIELGILKHFGLNPDSYLIDVGCGSGRLAQPLSHFLTGPYLGVDLVPELIAHARKIANRSDWRFEVIDHINIPEQAESADMVCFFSVLTHLLHEQSFWYLEEARRVLKPGGRVVFSFLEYSSKLHQIVFRQTVTQAKRKARAPLNVFIDREAIQFWAEELDLRIEGIYSGEEPIASDGALGQSLCVLIKPENPA